MVKTALVIVHYKGEGDTRACLQSFYGFTKDEVLPFIVTNSPSKQFYKLLKKEFPKVNIIQSTTNLGVAKGNNVGIKEALKSGCENFILLNNDTIVSPDLFKQLSECVQDDKHIGIVSPKIYFEKGFEYQKNRYTENQLGTVLWYAGGLIDWENIYAHHRGVDEVDHGQYERAIDTDFATGCCMLITRDVIEEIGFLDERYFLYFEDVDYCMRARQNGFRVIYYPKTCLWHKNASSSGSPGSLLHRYYQTRNRLYFGFHYSSLRTKKSLVYESLGQLIKGGIERKAIIDYYFGRMGKGTI